MNGAIPGSCHKGQIRQFSGNGFLLGGRGGFQPVMPTPVAAKWLFFHSYCVCETAGLKIYCIAVEKMGGGGNKVN